MNSTVVEIHSSKLRSKFATEWSSRKGGDRALAVAFHGTNSSNFKSISQIGLIVPGQGDGKGFRVVHGSALGEFEFPRSLSFTPTHISPPFFHFLHPNHNRPWNLFGIGSNDCTWICIWTWSKHVRGFFPFSLFSDQFKPRHHHQQQKTKKGSFAWFCSEGGS